jgi:hypothetical protein
MLYRQLSKCNNGSIGADLQIVVPSQVRSQNCENHLVTSCLSVRPSHSALAGRIFTKFDISVFTKCVDGIQASI